jgi:hypothetical protein
MFLSSEIQDVVGEFFDLLTGGKCRGTDSPGCRIPHRPLERSNVIQSRKHEGSVFNDGRPPGVTGAGVAKSS